jgi:hypothetical protein
LEKLRAHQLYAKFSKYKFWLTKVALLRHVIPAGRVLVDPGKVKDVFIGRTYLLDATNECLSDSKFPWISRLLSMIHKGFF